MALLAGIRDATRADPALGRDVGVLIQAVSGEEGGAMGTFGTRPLVESGFSAASTSSANRRACSTCPARRPR
ncbi:hypothetical protein [Saccharopolyspora spinosa]|uniref:hypothetical protein n=1 Tax=Saccharopolyspora spinosa TaxID=60894 RepID=UPI00376F19C3